MPRSSRWISRLSDDGSASLEFITVGLLLLVPLVYLVLTIAAVQGAALGVEGAARQASRVFVQSMLGHSDVRTTMRYAHPDHGAHRAAAARVAAFRKSGTAGLLRVEGLLGRQ